MENKYEKNIVVVAMKEKLLSNGKFLYCQYQKLMIQHEK